MDDSPRLLLIAGGILAVGLLVGYTIGHSGVRKARRAGTQQVERAEKKAEAAEAKIQATRKEAKAALAALAVCTSGQATPPLATGPLVLPERDRAVLRLTQAELALRTENAGIARTRLREATALLRTLAPKARAAAAKALRGVAAQLDGLRESTLRLDPRDRAAVERLAAQVQELRRQVRYLPL